MSDRPNLLILMSDQHHPRLAGFAGDAVVRTPNLDALASRGAVFERAYCNAPASGPSRMSFLTSRLPASIRCWSDRAALASDEPTFAHLLGAAGYQTALAGRMAFVGPDQLHGFAARLVGDVTPSFPVSEPRRDADWRTRADLETAGPGDCPFAEFDDAVAAAAEQFLTAAAPGAPRREPFCLVVGFALPHGPLRCERARFEAYLGALPPPPLPDRHPAELHPYHQRGRREMKWEDLPERVVRRARAAYAGRISMLDERIGRVLDALDASGLRDDTIIIYTSDHGDAAGEHGWWGARSFYDGAAGVPLIVSYPRRWPASRRGEIVSLADVAPTLSDVAGAAMPPHAVGDSLLPLLDRRAPAWKDEAVAELYGPGDYARMARRGEWKFCCYLGEPDELFHLQLDPDEFYNCAQAARCESIAEALRARAQAGWSPDAAARRRQEHQRGYALIEQWARAARPPDPFLWRPDGRL